MITVSLHEAHCKKSNEIHLVLCLIAFVQLPQSGVCLATAADSFRAVSHCCLACAASCIAFFSLKSSDRLVCWPLKGKEMEVQGQVSKATTKVKATSCQADSKLNCCSMLVADLLVPLWAIFTLYAGSGTLHCLLVPLTKL